VNLRAAFRGDLHNVHAPPGLPRDERKVCRYLSQSVSRQDRPAAALELRSCGTDIRMITSAPSGSPSEDQATSEVAHGPRPDDISKVNRYLAVCGAAATAVGLILWFSWLFVRTMDGLLVTAIVIWGLGALAGMLSILIGASEAPNKVFGFKNLAAATFTSPILIVAAIAGTSGSMALDQYIASVVGMSVLLAAFITAMLKSNVIGVRRDVLELALMEVGLIGTFTTALAVFMNR